MRSRPSASRVPLWLTLLAAVSVLSAPAVALAVSVPEARPDPGFDQIEKLLSDDPDSNDCAGYSVAISGNTAVVGAKQDDATATLEGAARVYIKVGSGWILQQTLTPPHVGEQEQFGYSVAIDGDTLVVGAVNDGQIAASAGAAYVYTRSGGAWTLQQKLVDTGGGTSHFFGWAVAIDGDTVAVGEVNAQISGVNQAGAVCVFTRSGGSWGLEQKVQCPSPVIGDRFGWSVSLSGDRLLVGAPGKDYDVTWDWGLAYVYSRSGGSWSLEQQLVSSDRAANDNLGYSVSIDGSTALVGAPNSSRTVSLGGAAYVFTQSGTSWNERTALAPPDLVIQARLGRVVSLDGSTAVCSAPFTPVDGYSNAGVAHVFAGSGASWSRVDSMTGSDVGNNYNFGQSVAVAGTNIVAGSLAAPQDAVISCGSAYLFGGNLPQTFATPEDTPLVVAAEGLVRNDYDADDHTIVASLTTDAEHGIVSVQTNGSFTYAPAADFNGSDHFHYCSGDAIDGYGASVAVTVTVTPVNDAPLAVEDTGTVAEDGALVVPDDGVLGNDVDVDGDTLTATLTAQAEHGTVTLSLLGGYTYAPTADFNGSDHFHYRVSDGTTLSAPATVTIAVTPVNDAPVAHDDPGPRQVARLMASDASAQDLFGFSVAVSGDTAVIGARAHNTTAGVDTGSAYVFTRSGSSWTQRAELTASDAAAYDSFGYSVAIDGDVVVVGAYAHDTTAGVNAGSAYVFVRTGSTWSEQAKLAASDGGTGHEFGRDVAVSGDTVIVGADAADKTPDDEAGAAYVFTRTGTTWSEQAKLTGSDVGAFEYSCEAVAISGDTALIAAPYDGSEAGAAYVFTRTGTTWSEQAKLTASDRASGDWFGGSLAVSNGTVVIGASSDDITAGVGAGSAYVYTGSGSTWSEQAKLTAPGAAANDQFGCSVGLSDGTVVIGAKSDDTSAGPNAGSAYVFKGSGASWSEQARLAASDGVAGDFFGVSVAASGDTQICGVEWDDNAGGFDAGSAYIFESAYHMAEDGYVDVAAPGLLANDTDTDGESLVATYYVAPEHGSGTVYVDGSWDYAPATDWHGTDHMHYRCADATTSSAFATVTIVVESVNDTPVAVDDTGTVAEDGALVVPDLGVLANDTDADGDSLTATLTAQAEHGTVTLSLLGGYTYAPVADFNGTDHFHYRALDGTASSGAATVAISVTPVNDAPVANSDPALTEAVKLLGSATGAGDNVGSSVAVDGDVAVIGAKGDDEKATAAGAAYVFRRSGGVWSREAKLTASDAMDGAWLGCSVAVSGDTVVVGAAYDGAVAPDAGAAYVFVRSGSVWEQQAKLTPSDATPTGDEFGTSVALSGDTALVGAYRDDEAASDAGAAYVFTRSGSVWSEQDKLLESGAAAGDLLGSSVALHGDTAVLGTPGDDPGGVGDAGSAYVFTRSGSTWAQRAGLAASDAAENDNLGYSVALDGGTAVVGAYRDDSTAGVDAGSAYVFTGSGAVWAEQAKLTASDGKGGDWFGNAVAVSGDTAIVGACNYDDADHTDRGVAYAFTRSGDSWREMVRLSATDAATADRYGTSVAVDGGTVVVGTPGDDDLGSGSGSGMIYHGLVAHWTMEDRPISGAAPGLLANDTDADGESLVATYYVAPEHGDGTVYVDGSWDYTPAPDWHGTDHMHYRCADATMSSAFATITITVTPVNDTPTADAGGPYTVAEDASLTLDASGSADVDESCGDTLTYAWDLDGDDDFLDATGETPTVTFPAPGVRTVKVRAADLAGSTDEATTTVTVTGVSGTVTRVPGSDRYAVAADMARKGWRNADGSWECTHVIVACGEDKAAADPLAAGGVAGIYDAPILLTKSSTLPYATKSVIAQIAAANPGLRVHLVGGTLSVPDARWTDIRRIGGVSGVKDRISGSDRYVVTANIAKRMVSVAGTTADFAGVLVICSENPAAFYDALAASPASFSSKMPMLGVKKGSVPTAVRAVLRDYLAGKTRYAVSSAGYISSTAYAQAGCTQRIANTTNRYVAATQIADRCVTENWLARSDTAITAKLSDALGGGAFMGNAGGVMLYTTVTSGIHTNTRSWIDMHSADITRGWVFGGTSSVPSLQETAFRDLLQ